MCVVCIPLSIHVVSLQFFINHLCKLQFALSTLIPMWLGITWLYFILTFSSDVHSQSAAMPAPTLEFAAICLRNGLFLVSPVDSGTPTCSTLPGAPIEGDAVTALRYASIILTHMYMYVHCTLDYLV